MKLTAPPTISEKQEIVRKRIFTIRSMDDVVQVLDMLKRERFMGRVSFSLGMGGTATSVEAEERAKVVT